MIDERTYLEAAGLMAGNSRCERRGVGSVLVAAGGAIAGVGWNRAPVGYPGCDACPRRTSGCSSGAVDRATSYDAGSTACYAVHAESVAILATASADRLGSTLYVSCKPCLPCELLAREAGVARVVYPGGAVVR